MGAAEKHLELYENPGISTSGNRIAAYQTCMRLYAHHLALAYCHSYWLPAEHTVQHSHSHFNTHLATPECIHEQKERVDWKLEPIQAMEMG